jgi:hypothetical protein
LFAARPLEIVVFATYAYNGTVPESRQECAIMMTKVRVCDQTTAGDTTGEYVFDLLSERISVRELIRSRVYQEVQDYNLKKPERFQGLVQPTVTEASLNGNKSGTPRLIDWHRQFEAALQGFKSNRVLVLVDERQVEDLDEEIVIEPDTQVVFLKLVPLVGG